MSAAFLITLREGLEISIVLAVLIGYLVKTDRRHDLTAVWLGTGTAVVACLIAGVAVHAVTTGLHGKAEPAVEGSLAISAAIVLTFMILWMRKNAHSMGGHLRSKVDGATTMTAVAAVAFIGVAREGFETVLFLLGAETGRAKGSDVVIGGLLGLAVSAVAGILLYLGSHRIDLRSFFRYTGVVLILFAAGLVGKAFHEFGELLEFEHGWLMHSAWTLTSGPFARGTFYDFLNGLFGWHASPERIRVLAYLAYVVPVMWLFLRTRPPLPSVMATTPAETSVPTG
ncbi:MAG: FTR1 family protein [Actinomycetota bacterium]